MAFIELAEQVLAINYIAIFVAILLVFDFTRLSKILLSQAAGELSKETSFNFQV